MTIQVLEEALALLTNLGSTPYSEEVSQSAHALQAAWLAEKETGDAQLITAALLHDIGHLLHKHGEKAAEMGIDDRHEHIGAGWLARQFGPGVTEPIKLHVDAKRYLCQVEEGYWDSLSHASKTSLELQGGTYSAGEAAAFIAMNHAEDAVKLRRWDDLAKVSGLETPDFDHFRPYVMEAAGAHTAAS